MFPPSFKGFILFSLVRLPCLTRLSTKGLEQRSQSPTCAFRKISFFKSIILCVNLQIHSLRSENSYILLPQKFAPIRYFIIIYSNYLNFLKNMSYLQHDYKS